MNILVLGGTQFLGRHFVERALKKGYSLTLFNRGKANPRLFTDVDKVIGDRTRDLHKLDGRQFDVVLDTCGYYPENLKYVVNELKEKVQKYIFISSCSVFDCDNEQIEKFDEDAPLVTLNIDVNDSTPSTYGARKYLCEEEVRKKFNENHFILRPGLIVGPFDPTYRFSYWADRVSEGGTVLCPGDPKAPLQFIDVRDLSDWILFGIENDLKGTFNVVSPFGELTLGDFLEVVKKEVNPSCELIWIDENYLKNQNVSCWSELPLWVYKEIQGVLKVDSSKAVKNGLKYRPIKDSIRDTFSWSKKVYNDLFLEKVLTREKEQKIIQSYKK